MNQKTRSLFEMDIVDELKEGIIQGYLEYAVVGKS